MNLDIYINQILKRLELQFYNQYIEEKGFMIWIDNGFCYYMSKITTMYCYCIIVIYMDWPA